MKSLNEDLPDSEIKSRFVRGEWIEIYPHLSKVGIALLSRFVRGEWIEMQNVLTVS